MVHTSTAQKEIIEMPMSFEAFFIPISIIITIQSHKRFFVLRFDKYPIFCRYSF